MAEGVSEPTLRKILMIEEVAAWTRIPESTLRYYRIRGRGGRC